jgi:SAM-dependent methyltransferase
LSSAAPLPLALPPIGDPLRFTTLAHSGRRVLGPISDERLDAIVARLALPPRARAVELACGKGELLVRLLATYRAARATGVDRSPWFLADARHRAIEAGVAERIELLEADASAFKWPVGSADLAIAIGASGILGDQRETLAALARMACPDGGLVLFGDGVWVGEPPREGLESFGMDRAELPEGLGGQRELGSAAGLEPVWSELVSTQEWDDYETAYASVPEAWAGRNPADPDRDAFLERATLMRESYESWRRDAFGFGLTLFRR